jgi:nucleoside-diphosphate-sugar epimerase
MPRALVIGGTGPTGPYVVRALHERGYETTVLHGGQHEVEFDVPDVEHIHTDPHFRETLEPAVAGRVYDVVVAQYGRLRVVADVFAGRTERLIAIGSATGIFADEHDERWGALGRPAVIRDASEVYVDSPDVDKLRFRMVESMRILMDHHAKGHYKATYIGYPLLYGPRQPKPLEWTIVRRLLDGRDRLIIADGGLKLETRVYAENAAHGVAVVLDNPDVASGKRYTVAEREVFSLARRIRFIAAYLDRDLDLVDMPYELAWPCHPLWRNRREHLLTDGAMIREELGYQELVTAEIATTRTIDWLMEHRPVARGELEQQVGDPFDYDAEDALIDRWVRARDTLGPVVVNLPTRRHAYRHPKAPGERWGSPEDEPNTAG